MVILLSITFLSERAFGAGCAGLTNTTTLQGIDINILCNSVFLTEQVYSVLYTASFEDCILECIDLLADVDCVGVQFSPSTLAPTGLNGSTCSLQWALGGNPSQSDTWDSARIQRPAVVPSEVFK
jgi:hypothetical protein